MRTVWLVELHDHNDPQYLRPLALLPTREDAEEFAEIYLTTGIVNYPEFFVVGVQNRRECGYYCNVREIPYFQGILDVWRERSGGKSMVYDPINDEGSDV